MNILILDNYDSFVYNLAQGIGALGADPVVHRNDALSLKQIKEIKPDGIIISPGPGTPENSKDFGICLDVLQKLPHIPTLGVCLGHQGLGYAYGGKITQAKQIMHGKKSDINHSQNGLFKGLKKSMSVMRYHSLIVEKESLPECFMIEAETTEGEIFAIKHKKYPQFGVQFHPESIETEEGMKLLKNFLKVCE